MDSREFDAKNIEYLRERERIAIRAVIEAKRPRIATVKQTSTDRYEELSEAMHYQSNTVLPDILKDALEGQSADAGNEFLKKIKKPDLKTPVKGG